MKGNIFVATERCGCNRYTEVMNKGLISTYNLD